MEKPAEAQYPILDLLRRRWSPRAFADRLVEPEKLRGLLEAARWAPSSYNEQPWNFLVATKDDPENFQRLLSCLVEGNQAWAQFAPVLMISVARLNFAQNGQPNRHAFHDVGLAAESLVIQAMALDLMVHQMAGFYPDKARDVFRIPPGFEPVAAIAVGYPGEPDRLPEKLRQRELAPRTRKTLREFVFGGEWGRPAGVVAQS
jgi:nitroreductase